MDSDDDDDIKPVEILPIYRKGKEILDVVIKITALIPENDEYLSEIKGCLLSDAALLTVKVAGAEAAGLYDLKMENAAIIRKAARDLMVQNHSLDAFGFEYVEYYHIVRDLIEDYRLLFIDWVAGFDKWDYIIDRWGLFNPPGVGPLNSRIADHLSSMGFQLPDSSQRSPHMFGAIIPDKYKGNLVSELSKRKIYISQRGNSIRFSPHLHVLDNDLERLLETLNKIFR